MNQDEEPRLPLLDQAEATRRAEESGIPTFLAPLSIFRVLLHHPSLSKPMSDLLGVLLFEGRLDARLRELIVMRLGWSTGSVYEWTQHWRIATGLGIPAEDLVAVRDWRSSPRFGEAERAVLSAVDETVEGGAVSAETWVALQRHVGVDPVVLLEVLGAVGVWRMVSGLLLSLQVPLEPGIDGWPPDGIGPA